MDPCLFLRILVGNFAIKFPANSKQSSSTASHTSTSPYYCKIRLSNRSNNQFPVHLAKIPLLSPQQQEPQHGSLSNSLAACFTLNETQIKNYSVPSENPPKLKIDIFKGSQGMSCGLLTGGKLLGRVSVTLGDLGESETRKRVIHSGWVSVGGGKKGSSAEFHLRVRAEPDPRFVFQFGGEPECSPQIFQVQGNTRQAVFTSKFSGCRNAGDRNLGTMTSMSEPGTPRNWLPSLGSNKDQSLKERKGWSITIHDLSGSPVAMASMVTPFVPSPRSDQVSKSNPGAWLILRPGHGTWNPWGRLEAWRDNSHSDAVSYRFDLLHDTATPTTVANSTISGKTGGKFTIDMSSSEATPVNSPHSSCDFGSGSASGSWSSSDFGSLPQVLYRGFVMSSSVEGAGKCSKPEVEVGVQHVTCTEDAAAFVALGAAMDLSMDACKSFSHRLRKELRQQSQGSVV
ncbi:hypothetical protein HS088_TW08G00556 [Tripterygium wilfordii]|uniref:Formin-like protein 18 n=1 Tax=Tripterygium wilfordii TaxID=458696 RepID=A0A7J7DCI3_TRIWF|nr:uncharacterized protein LOC120004462 [Tripterygium wilfordii]KAF5743968.1 hypothetical protein HS088_TW08G00556 [Tripterygium wilfordii]